MLRKNEKNVSSLKNAFKTDLWKVFKVHEKIIEKSLIFQKYLIPVNSFCPYFSMIKYMFGFRGEMINMESYRSP